MSGMSVTLEYRTQTFQRSQVAYPTSLLQENNPFSSDKTGFGSITFFTPLVALGACGQLAGCHDDGREDMKAAGRGCG